MATNETKGCRGILRKIDKQEGHGPYLWVVGYRRVTKHKYITELSTLNCVVFSYWSDAKDYCDAVEANGNRVEFLELASDFCRVCK